MSSCAGGYITVIRFSIQSWSSPLKASWSHSTTLSNYPNLASSSSPRSLAANVLLINTPQLAVSLVYVFYNSLLTRMFVANEYSKFATKRQVLRVSQPRGSQRSTYWLQLPYQYILPIMTSVALLHWLISRSIYLTNIKVYNIAGQEAPDRSRFAYATSGLGLLLAFLVGTGLLAFLFVLMGKKLASDMPVIGTCSLAISAASHPAEVDEDASTKPLIYGAVEVSQQPEGHCWHACFCSKGVVLLKEDVIYF